MTRRRILFLADSASQLKPAYALAEAFRESRDWEVVGNLVPGKALPSRRQVIDANLRCPVTAHSLSKMAELGLYTQFDAVVAFLPGSRLHALVAHLDRTIARHNPRSRPALITGYNGVVYEGHLEGLLWRTGYDFICVNSRADLRRFTADLEELGQEGERLIATGYLLAQGGERRAPPPYAEMPSKDVLFATQAVVPSSRAEREYVIEGFRAYAEAFPDRRVIIKPRSLPGERTFHEERHHYAVLYEQLFGRLKPPNLLFGYGSLAGYLSRVGLVVSVSSTAVVEAISHGVPGAILGDFGIKESLGNHFFRSSGMMTTLPKLIADQVPVAREKWLEDNGFAPDDSLEPLIDEVESFLGAQERSGKRARMLRPFYDGEHAPYIHQRILPVRGPRPSRIRGPVESAYRKARKLVRSPRQFFADAWIPGQSAKSDSEH
jgi:hypothetical protein